MAIEVGDDAACDGDDADAGEGSTVLLALCSRDRLYEEAGPGHRLSQH